MKDFEKLHQLILIKVFKGYLPNYIKTYIDEQKAESLQQAALLAYDYSLTHMLGNYKKLPNSDATHRNFPTVIPSQLVMQMILQETWEGACLVDQFVITVNDEAILWQNAGS